MPTDAEIREYAESLPPIYRNILEAFPSIEPNRAAGYGVAFQTLAAHLANRQRGYSMEDVRQACMLLATNGFFEIKNGIFAHPTDLGERLIAAATNRPVAPRFHVPQLPARSW